MVTNLARLGKGTRFGAYQIRAHLGTGGMAEVYRAIHLETGQKVALKVLGSSWTAVPEALSRFAREVQAIRAATHPNVVTIYEVGLESRPPFIAMEYVRGRTLRARLNEGGPLPLESALSIAIQLADGLTSVHAAGIVHRDLKPENVMVSPEGDVKILDFGLSKSLRKRSSPVSPDESLTVPGMILGTLHYMSPEQARGRRADFRADQFSLGAILCEMITGEAAFPGNSIPTILAAVIGAEPAGIEALRAKGADVRAIVERALAKSPDDRYPSMLEMESDLVGARRRRRGVIGRFFRGAASALRQGPARRKPASLPPSGSGHRTPRRIEGTA